MNTLNVSIGKDIMLTVDMGRLSNQPESMAHIIAIGLKNVLQDSHSSITKDDFPDEKIRKANSLAIAEKKLESLYNNDVRTKVARSGGQSAEEKLYVKAMLALVTKQKRKELAKMPDSGAAWLKAAIVKHIEKVKAKAAAMLEAEREAEAEQAALEAELDFEIET